MRTTPPASAKRQGKKAHSASFKRDSFVVLRGFASKEEVEDAAREQYVSLRDVDPALEKGEKGEKGKVDAMNRASSCTPMI